MKRLKPFYKRHGITIYHADSRDVLPTIADADLVLADPPYGMKLTTPAIKSGKHTPIANDDKLPLDLIWLAISKARVGAYVFCRWNEIPAMPKAKSVIVWNKQGFGQGDTRHEHGRQWEACLFYPQKQHRFTKRIGDVITAKKTGNVHHPTQKPVELLAKLILANRCDTVLDPFAGCGSSLVAARLCGKKAIGIELELKYCEAAVKRLESCRPLLHSIDEIDSKLDCVRAA